MTKHFFTRLIGTKNKIPLMSSVLLASTFLCPVGHAKTFSFDDYNNHFYVGGDEVYEKISGTASGITNDYGSAIHNQGTIEEIDADFLNNTANVQGGAILNDLSTSYIGKITGNFKNNVSKGEGAIYNRGTIDTIEGSIFENNKAGVSSYGHGGAINNSGMYGKGVINNILNAQFLNNTASGVGGAISNRDGGQIGDVSGIFKGNSANQGSILYNFGSSVKSLTGTFENNSSSENIFNLDDNSGNKSYIGTIAGSFTNNSGSAIIYNMRSVIDTIDADFTGNNGITIKNLDGTIGTIAGGKTFKDNQGGPQIMNLGTRSDITTKIGDITANFINNNSNGENGTIYNYKAEIGNITGNFESNKAQNGGAIWNQEAKIQDINGFFDKNTSLSGDGGAVHNTVASIENINASFTNNSANYNGGAISNNGGSIKDIEGGFANNTSIYGQGGAIYNYRSTIENIKQSLFDNNKAKSNGGAIFNIGKIGNIEGAFTNNTTENGQGGAIYNNSANIGDITKSLFDNNKSSWEGGAIFNSDASIGNIEGGFSNNSTSQGQGGAIYNNGAKIGNITKSFFVNNKAKSNGGAIFNSNSTIGNIEGDFANNVTETGQGGAIFNNNAKIGNITKSFFTNNTSTMHGGAIWNGDANIGNIEADFSNNKAEGERYGQGGAIFNNRSTIENITGNFDGNFASNYGGGIWNDSTIGNIKGNFSNNVSGKEGGAIWNIGKIGDISGIFYNNTAENGAGIFNINNGSDPKANSISLVNSSFVGNTAKNSASEEEMGAAVFSEGNVSFKTNNGYNALISGNKVTGNADDAFYIKNANLSLTAKENSSITFDDDINGNNYNIDVYGDGTGVVRFNGLVKNVNDMNLHENSITHLGINANIDAKNFYTEGNASIIKNPSIMAMSSSKGNTPLLTVDVYVDRATNKVHSGTITVDGDISGKTHILVNALNPDILDDYHNAITPFLYAPNDDEETSAVFEVSRVNGSPYLWYADANVIEKPESGNVWYLSLTDKLNPNFDRTQVVPEVVSYIGLHSAAIEQTRNVSRIARDQAAALKTHCTGTKCGLYEDSWNGKPLMNAWAYVDYETSTIDKPVDIDADIWGVTGGFDLQSNVNHKLGIFASYRQGDYDLSGKGAQHHAKSGSQIDIDSYLGGLYYRYDKNDWWAFATLFGGIQKADLKTDDGIVDTDTDGTQFGMSLEGGKLYSLAQDLTLEPSLGVFYTQVDFDNIRDNNGKTAKYNTVQHWELEAGIKLEKSFGLSEGTAKVYFKPSLIQTLTDNDKVTITGMYPVSTYHDQTLGRFELGGKVSIGWSWSLYSWVNYTYGSSYDAIAAGAGLNYAW